MHPCVARTIDRLASISRVGSRLTHVKIPALEKRFQGRDAVGRQRRSALSLDAKFAPASPLEGSGFELSVPLRSPASNEAFTSPGRALHRHWRCLRVSAAPLALARR